MLTINSVHLDTLDPIIPSDQYKTVIPSLNSPGFSLRCEADGMAMEYVIEVPSNTVVLQSLISVTERSCTNNASAYPDHNGSRLIASTNVQIAPSSKMIR